MCVLFGAVVFSTIPMKKPKKQRDVISYADTLIKYTNALFDGNHLSMRDRLDAFSSVCISAFTFVGVATE